MVNISVQFVCLFNQFLWVMLYEKKSDTVNEYDQLFAYLFDIGKMYQYADESIFCTRIFLH